ncbi:MAG TPA: ATP-binding protein [Burkholderiaceae bacterium]|nr:ATP-binding protein [Burkholderiaceae bacterium]
MDKRPFLHTLTGKTLLRLAVAGTVLLVAAAAVNSYVVYRQSEGEALLRLSASAAERARVAERVLGYTVETHETVRLAFVQKWPSYQDRASLERFETFLKLYPDGNWRNREQFADGTVYPTGWVPKRTPLTDELRRLLVLFWDLSSHYGPGAAIRHDNLFFMSVPDESNLGYDPYLFPQWVFDIPENFTQLDYEWGRLAYMPARPGDRSRFATPEVDDIGPQLGPIFQVLTPIHLGERHVATVATTLLFNEFLARAFPDPRSERRYLILNHKGRLLADTHESDRALPSASKATLQVLGGDLPDAMLAATRAATGSPQTGYTAKSDSYFAIARIDGPDWYVASLLAGAAVRADAFRVALWASAAHIGVLVALLALLAYILRRQVAAPLGELTRAADRVASGDVTVRLPAGREDELGRLALAFNDMASRVAERDAALRQDKQQIEAALTSLRLTEERWRAMTDNATDFIAVVDEDGKLTYVSPPVRKALGQPAESFVGRLAFELVHPDDAAQVRQRVLSPEVSAFEFRARHADGDWRILEAIGSDMRHHPAIRGVVLNIRDISQQARAEKELRQAQKLEAIGTLAGGIAHDFNNILAAIIGYGEMARKEALEGTKLKRHIDSAMSAAMRAKALVERILAFSRGGMGERAAVHVQSVIEEALDVACAALPAEIRVERKLHAGDAAVAGDPTQVHQIAMNLCSNAIQAMSTSGTLTVALDLIEARAAGTRKPLPAGNYVRLVVRDTGAGMSANVLERIFDPFFTTKGVLVGTGLGLSLVHSIVKDLGGHIEVASELDKGSTFTVYLPSTGTVAATAPIEHATVKGKGEIILLVDDEEALVRLGEEMIAKLGYEPVGFTSSAAALEKFRSSPEWFDAVLSDEAMPDLSGSELAREIRKIRTDIPIVLVSGFISPALAARAQDAGVSAVLAKPLLAHEVARSLANALRR